MLREVLSAARGIGDAGMRTKASAGVAKCLPAEERQNVLAEALSVARGIDDADVLRGRALQEVAQRLPTGEALVVARGIDDAIGPRPGPGGGRRAVGADIGALDASMGGNGSRARNAHA